MKSSYVDIFNNRLVLDNAHEAIGAIEFIKFPINIGGYGLLVHELCHHWCFDTPVGSAISTIAYEIQYILLQGFDRYPRYERRLLSLFRAYKNIMEVLTPISEGIAHFAEFDLGHCPEAEIRKVGFLNAALTFGPDGYDGFLAYSKKQAPIDRRASLFLARPNKGNWDYFVGYAAIKSLWKTIAFEKQQSALKSPIQFIEYIRSAIFEDDFIVWLVCKRPETVRSELTKYIATKIISFIRNGVSDEDINVREYQYRTSMPPSSIFQSHLDGNYTVAVGIGSPPPNINMDDLLLDTIQNKNSKDLYIFTMGRSMLASRKWVATQSRPSLWERAVGYFNKPVLPSPNFGFFYSRPEREFSNFVCRRSLLDIWTASGEIKSDGTTLSFFKDGAHVITIIDGSKKLPYSGSGLLKLCVIPELAGLFHVFVSFPENAFSRTVAVAAMLPKEVRIRGRNAKIDKKVLTDFIWGRSDTEYLYEKHWAHYRPQIDKWCQAKMGDTSKGQERSLTDHLWNVVLERRFPKRVHDLMVEQGLSAIFENKTSRIVAFAKLGLTPSDQFQALDLEEVLPPTWDRTTSECGGSCFHPMVSWL